MIGIITNKSVGNDGYVIFFEKKVPLKETNY